MIKILLLVLAVATNLAVLAPAWAGQVTDLAGRSISVPAKVERIVLGEGRTVSALAILDRGDPLGRVVGSMGDFPLLDPAGHALWLDHFPRLADVPAVGKVAAESFSVERTIALKPDLVLFAIAGHGPNPRDGEILRQLEDAGITVAFVDFFLDPLVNTPRSITLLGALLGRRTEAAEFVGVYGAQLRRVTEPLKATSARPVVFIENRVGLQAECCASIGDGVLGRMITAAGGRNLASALIPGHAGTISLEYLLTHQPDIYLGTAVGHLAGADRAPERIVLGPGVPASVAEASLRRALARPGIADLRAVRERRAHALWHHFVHSPFNVVAVQALAKRIHPALFADLDPAATLRDMTARFQPMTLDGTFWIDLP